MSEFALNAVRRAAQEFRDGRKEIEAEAARWVESQMEARLTALELAVVHALNTGENVTAVSRAYAAPGTEGNRPLIYSIQRKYRDAGMDEIIDAQAGDSFRWVKRTVESKNGERVVWDVQATLDGFGPDEIVGTYVWRYDNGWLEEYQEDWTREPYPNEPYYSEVLQQWHARNPYPEEER